MSRGRFADDLNSTSANIWCRRKGANAIALEIFAPLKNDLGITWVDWNPTPADKDSLGIWKEVFLTADDGVSVRNPYVTSKLENDYKAAALTVSADLRNTSDKAVDGVLAAEVEGGIHIKQDVKLAAGETKTITFNADKFSEVEACASPALVAVSDERSRIYTRRS